MIDELAQGIHGLVTIGTTLPRQVWRTAIMLPSAERAALLRRVGLGGSMVGESYFFETPQLYRMPAQFPRSGNGPPPVGAYKEGSLTKALPYIAGGIALVVAYNMFLSKPKRKRNITAAKRRSLPLSRFAFPEQEKLPIDTKKRTRAAMSRFSQTDFPSSAAKARAYRRIVRRAESLGIDPAGFESRWEGRYGTR